MRTTLQGADRGTPMKPCFVCGKDKSPHQKLAIRDGRLVHTWCRE